MVGDVDPGGIEAARRGRDVRPRRRRQDRIADQAARHRRLLEAGPPVGAPRLDARRVRGDGLMDPCGHPAHRRQQHRQVDNSLLQPDTLAGHLRPIRNLHQHGQNVVTEVAVQLVCRPGRRPRLGFLTGLLLATDEAFLGDVATLEALRGSAAEPPLGPRPTRQGSRLGLSSRQGLHDRVGDE
ncbi:hypothetical protein ACFCYC_11800 [Streptomyces sp. NPDC056402]|uniref:hypothetical protein n=1 Tax=Streptomyces sp. NPDC056402 TaxID=3345810 RepID=UPI0035DF32B4